MLAKSADDYPLRRDFFVHDDVLYIEIFDMILECAKHHRGSEMVLSILTLCTALGIP